MLLPFLQRLRTAYRKTSSVRLNVHSTSRISKEKTARLARPREFGSRNGQRGYEWCLCEARKSM